MNSSICTGLLCCLLSVLPAPSRAETETPMDTETNRARLFSFEQESLEGDWYSIDDRVMGGVSRSALLGASETTRIFGGHLSLEQNGGFASVRSASSRFDLSEYEAIELRVRGDGKRYKLCLKTDGRFDGVIYQSGFDTEAGQWATVRIPLSAFTPTWRGRPVPQAGPLDPSRIRTFGLMISDGQQGDFALEVDWIDAARRI